jgi:hypothetical protein
MILSPYKSSLKRGYVDQEFYIEDTTPTSPNYFDITEFPDYIGGGKSIIKIKGGGVGLKFGSEIEAEVLDVNGDVVYSEFPEFVDKFNNIYLSIYVYDFIAKGVGTVSLVGTAQYDPDGDVIPEGDSDSFNLRWTRDILILPDVRNNSIIDFTKGPAISVAQIITPFKVLTAYTSSLIQEVTSSNINYISTDPEGYDFDQSTVEDVLDETLNNILINPNATSRTANNVYAPPRERDYDINNGFILRENTRFNTYIYTTESFFKKDMTGGQFTFLSQPSSSLPQLASGSTLVDTLENQLTTYAGNIVRVVDQYRALIDKPVRVITTTPGSLNNTTTSFKYTKLNTFTSSIVYKPSDLTFITSSNVTQSYLQFTFNNIDPIGGQVYRIKAFYKTSGQTGDYKLLNDQYIKNIEILTDPSRPNQVPYAKNEGDFYLIGHFTDVRELETDVFDLFNTPDWTAYYESPTQSFQTTTTTSSLYLSDSAILTSSYSDSRTFILTTSAYQAYTINKIYTLSFNCCLTPGAELEIYGNSNQISTNTQQTLSGFALAFLATENREKTRYADNFNRFGKYIGSIKNNSKNIKNYGRVVFDFEADNDGIGRPLFRLKSSDFGSATGYISEVSIKPQQLQGFTPNLLQYAVPTDSDFAPILSQSVDFKFEYYDYTGNQSEFVSYLKDIKINLTAELPSLGCQSEKKLHGFSAQYIRGSTTPLNFIDSNDNGPWGYSTNNGAPSGALALAGPNVKYQKPTIYQYINGILTDDNIHWNAGYYSRNGTTNTFNGPFNTAINYDFDDIVYMTSSWVHFDPSIDLVTIDYTLNYPVGETSYDGRYFTYGPACCINRIDTWTNWDSWDSEGGFNNSTIGANDTRNLMNNRLFWPRIGQPTLPIAQRKLPNYFTENGGVYQVTFKVKPYLPQGGNISDYVYAPISGSKLNVFIHNVFNQPYQTSNPYSGLDGNYPPQQNIQTITFDQNINWTNSETGYIYAQYSLTLVQYGSFAQLVFEASGSNFNATSTWDGYTTNVKAFGGCIDDIQVCKIGRTTDPYYIKPETVGGGTKPGNPQLAIVNNT